MMREKCERCKGEIGESGALVGTWDSVVVYCNQCLVKLVADAMVRQEVQGAIDAMETPVERN